jgi:hypothetical protein
MTAKWVKHFINGNILVRYVGIPELLCQLSIIMESNPPVLQFPLTIYCSTTNQLFALLLNMPVQFGNQDILSNSVIE